MSKPANGSRESILGDIRSALGADRADRARQVIVQNRLRGHGRNLIPSRAELPPEAQQKLFQNMLETQSATVAHISSVNKLPYAVGRYLASHNLEKTVRTGHDPLFDHADWGGALVLRKQGHAMAEDAASLSHAIAGASETGTLFLLSGAANPTSLNFLPENHIVVVHARDIMGSYEDVWEWIRQITDADRQGASQKPRTVNLISGPSRTGDIEQTIIMGAHGPRRLHVIIIDED